MELQFILIIITRMLNYKSLNVMFYCDNSQWENVSVFWFIGEKPGC